jgi:hypothetical protein
MQQFRGRDVCTAGQNLVGSHGGRHDAGIGGCLNSAFLYFSLPVAAYTGDAPSVGDWETVGRRGRAGQETLPKPAQQIRWERKHASTATLQHASVSLAASIKP